MSLEWLVHEARFPIESHVKSAATSVPNLLIRNKQGSCNQTRIGMAELKGTLRPGGKIKVISADNPSIVGDYAFILFKIAFSVES